MLFVFLALASIIGSLIFGRLLAKASAEQTRHPHRVHGPVTGTAIEVDRLAIAKEALQRRVAVSLN
jgi:hypothetical protein